MKEKTLAMLKGLGTIFIYFFITIWCSLIFDNFLNSDNNLISGLFQIISYLIVLAILILIYFKMIKKDSQTFKKEYINIAIKSWILGLGIMLICNILISTFFQSIPLNEATNRTILSKYPISSIINMIIIGPFIEELTFRASFKNAFNKWYTFAIFTALIFGSAHIMTFFISLTNNEFKIVELLYLLPYSALGFFFAKAYYETDNIFTSYIAHFCHNALCIILLLLFG